jgi:uncharacterized tellurite resistance protein B-like protein
MDFFPEIEISQTQAEAIARGLFAVARADGNIHEREALLIADFFTSTTDRATDLGALERSENINGASLSLLLPSPELRRLFLKTAMLLAYADGNYGAAESQMIGDYAKALETSDNDLRTLETQVKEWMLGQLGASVSNTSALAQVAGELKL